MSEIKVSILVAAKDIRSGTRQIDPPAADEVQVAVKCTTLCGSDLHYFTQGRNGNFLVREPLSLGHESSGVVVQVGDKVKDLKTGDRVALEVGLPCGTCINCRSGRYNLCPDMKFRSSAKIFPHLQGTLQERINQPASWCHKIPDSISFENAALIEPLSVAIHAVCRARLTPGDSVLVLGAGAVGLLTAAVARINGATTIVMADITKNRIDFALENGFATHGYVVPLKRGSNVEENLEISKELSHQITQIPANVEGPSEPLGLFNTTFECTGVQSCVQAGIYATAPGGKVMFVGMGNPVQTLDVGAAALREVDLLGVFRYANTYPIAVNLLNRNLIPSIDKLITHKFEGLDQTSQAFEMAGKTTDENGSMVIKVAIMN